MNFIKTIMALNFIMISLHGMSSADKEEIIKMEFARYSQKEKTNGFQGCANKEKCGDHGFYLKTYSQEGLCNDCEFVQHPERFVACIFCRCPFQKFSKDTLSTCHSMCNSFIEKIIVNNTKIDDKWEHKQALKMGAFSYLSKTDNIISKKYIKAFGNSKTQFMFGNEVNKKRKTYGKFGIYLGALQQKNGNTLHVWTDTLSIDPQDKKLVTDWNDAEKHIEYICKKYNVFGPETGEITLKEIPNRAVTFEEFTENSHQRLKM